jgi:hypothetical protein
MCRMVKVELLPSVFGLASSVMHQREKIARIRAIFSSAVVFVRASARFILVRASERKKSKEARAPAAVFNNLENSAITKIKNFKFLMLQICII